MRHIAPPQFQPNSWQSWQSGSYRNSCSISVHWQLPKLPWNPFRFDGRQQLHYLNITKGYQRDMQHAKVCNCQDFAEKSTAWSWTSPVHAAEIFSAPASSNSFTITNLPLRTARCSGVALSALELFFSVPAFSKSHAISRWLPTIAQCNAADPPIVLLFASALAYKSCRLILYRPDFRVSTSIQQEVQLPLPASAARCRARSAGQTSRITSCKSTGGHTSRSSSSSPSPLRLRLRPKLKWCAAWRLYTSTSTAQRFGQKPCNGKNKWQVQEASLICFNHVNPYQEHVRNRSTHPFGSAR